MARSTRSSTVPSPTPASNIRTAGGRGWMLASSSADAVRHHPFLAAGIDKQQIFLAVVEEAEIALRALAGRGGARRGGGPPGSRRHRRSGPVGARAFDHRAAEGRVRAAVRRHEGADAVERVGGDAAAVAQPAGELAVVDGAPAEGRLLQARSARQKSEISSGWLRSWRALGRFLVRPGSRLAADSSRPNPIKANQTVPETRQPQKHPIAIMGRVMGTMPRMRYAQYGRFSRSLYRNAETCPLAVGQSRMSRSGGTWPTSICVAADGGRACATPMAPSVAMMAMITTPGNE